MPNYEDEMTGSIIASEALMLRAGTLKTILLVEGTSDDKLLGSFVDKAECDVVIAYGKENLLEALEILRKKGEQGIICLVDADFSRIDGAMIADKDIVVTEFHDLEVSLFHSSAFDRVLNELGSRTKLKTLRNNGDEPLDRIIAAAHPIGALRYYGHKKKIPVKFKQLSYKFVDRKKLICDVDQLITEAFNHSKIALIDTKREAICEFVANCIERTQHTQACCGHDLAAIFGMGLQHLFGSQKAITVSREAVETLMRLAFGFEDLKQSSIFNDIRTWEASNAPRKCLRA